MTKSPPARAPKPSGPIAAFLADIEPFFYKRPVIYVDVGAHRGQTFEALRSSGLSVNRALLLEANPTNFAVLREAVSNSDAGPNVTCLNVAVSDAAGTVQINDMNDMSRILDADAAEASGDASQVHAVEARTLDSFADLFPDGHVSILKIDVEGHEAQALRGAHGLLSSHGVDVLYVEAGLNPDNPQQTYYRIIEDLLREQGYRLFRVYEQTNEWIEDSPVLRRFNMAFISPVLAARHPFRLTQELVRMRARLTAEAAAHEAERSENVGRIQALSKAVEDAERGLREAMVERDAARTDLKAQAATRESIEAERDRAVADQAESAGRIERLSKAVEDAEDGLRHAVAERDTARAELAALAATRDAEAQAQAAERSERLEEITRLTGSLESIEAERDRMLAERDALAERLQSEAAGHEAALAERFEEIATLTRFAEERQAEAAEASLKATRAESDAATARQETSEAKESAARARRELGAAQEIAAKAKRDLDKARERLAAKSEELERLAEEFQRSTSWRVTAPLRWVGTRLRRG